MQYLLRLFVLAAVLGIVGMALSLAVEAAEASEGAEWQSDPCIALTSLLSQQGQLEDHDRRLNLIGCDLDNGGVPIYNHSACNNAAHDFAAWAVAVGLDVSNLTPNNMRVWMALNGCGVIFDDWSWDR